MNHVSSWKVSLAPFCVTHHVESQEADLKLCAVIRWIVTHTQPVRHIQSVWSDKEYEGDKFTTVFVIISSTVDVSMFIKSVITINTSGNTNNIMWNKQHYNDYCVIIL